MQENEQKLQETEGGTEHNADALKKTEEESPISEPNTSEDKVQQENTEKTNSSPPEETTTTEVPPKEIEAEKATEEIEESNAEDAEKATATEEPSKEPEAEKVIEEIEESNAEDAEDVDNEKRHHIPMLDYHSMSIENLVGELQRLVKNEKIQAINKHVSSIKYEFDQKFQEFLEHKKEEFVANGGNEIDFRYNSVAKRQFNEVFGEYREKKDQYYKQLDQNLKSNLKRRLEIIEQLKGLMNVEEDINTTYKNFKDLQENWRNAGPIPRNNYNDVWRTYHHHMEIFYDFLHLNRELRDLDFKHNLEEKMKLVERAELLAKEPDLGKAFRELQTLHKIWKEDIGPVAKEQREEVWGRFSNATKAMHQRRQEHYQELEKDYEKNLVKKQEVIASIMQIADNITNNHRALQQQIKEIEALREAFFKAGKVPQKVNEQTWSAFKDAVRKFNRNKNAFYKSQKKEQHENLEKKRALLGLAVALKDSDDREMATPEMKRIQSEWKKIGHVPRKYSDKIWNEFKDACNHYFNRLHAEKNESQKEEYANFEKKSACLDRIKAFQLTGDKEKDLNTVKKFIAEWKTLGRIPYNKKHINGKFNKIVDALFTKLGVSKQESELLKYGDKMQQLAKTDDNRAIGNERVFIRRKIEESKSEIRQLENNLQFFSNASEDSPLVKDVVNNINRHKEALETWKAKLKKLNIMENNLNKAAEESDEDAQNEEE
ncbi:DUF349 domain-containing protein [Flagellimonas hymeniacidonis]|uniref:DUF349 domain-containing protein n=1 Tax=Flagellimonas hymeniacidonis TaxID=2603628 RepID=A0A5C8V044_9FLAO|nr:DUF349 domain-containing protein [Flagellimonas hymeniacidonis]TXN35143.1 DUF349 domain-containing protein [Flagellimonas hymeniacidonis]